MDRYSFLLITAVMTAAFFIGIENACANDWYESMESSTLDYASYQNAAKSVDPVGVASQDKAVSGVFSQAILSRDAINSELQKEIALQAANQIQVIRPNAGGGGILVEEVGGES